MYIRQIKAQSQSLELARSFYLLSHYYQSANNVPLRSWVSLLRALNVAESVGASNNPLLAEIYSEMSFHLRFQLPNWRIIHSLANYYRRLSQEVKAQGVCSSKTHGYLALHDCWERIVNGELSGAASTLLIVKNYFIQSGRVRSAWEVTIFRGIFFYLQGNILECLRVSGEIQQIDVDKLKYDKRVDADASSSVVVFLSFFFFLKLNSSQQFQKQKTKKASLVWWNKILLLLGLIHQTPLENVVKLLNEIDTIQLPENEVKWTENRLLQKILMKSILSFVRCRQNQNIQSLVFLFLSFFFFSFFLLDLFFFN